MTISFKNLNGVKVSIAGTMIQDLGMIGVFVIDGGTMISVMQDGEVFDITNGAIALIGTEGSF